MWGRWSERCFHGWAQENAQGSQREGVTHRKKCIIQFWGQSIFDFGVLGGHSSRSFWQSWKLGLRDFRCGNWFCKGGWDHEGTKIKKRYGTAGRGRGTRQQGKELTEEQQDWDVLLSESRRDIFKRDRVHCCPNLQKDEKAYCNEHCRCTATFSWRSFSASGHPVPSFNVLLAPTAYTCDSSC